MGERQTGSTNLQASSLVQTKVPPLVEQWGYDGFEISTRNVCSVYGTKRDIFDEELQEHPGDVAEDVAKWNKAESGLFSCCVYSCSDCMESSPFQILGEGPSGCGSCNVLMQLGEPMG